MSLQALGLRVIALPLCVVVLLGGCATSRIASPVEDRSTGTGQAAATQLPEGVEVFPAEVTNDRSLEQRSVPLEMGSQTGSAPATLQSPAVVALLDSAGTQAQTGKLDSAAAALERALRIEPQNPSIWQRLAEVRLQQDQFEQAETLAHKSNSLAGNDPTVQARNWTIIAEARRARGDAPGARDAEAQAAKLRAVR